MKPEMTKPTKFLDWLQEHGITEFPKGEELAKLKKEHRRQYQKVYYRNYNREKHNYRFTLTTKEVDHFKELGQRYPQFRKGEEELNLSGFIVGAAKAYCEQKRIPENPKLLREIQIELRRIGNNINQLVHRLHRRGSATANDVELLRKRVLEIEKRITK